MTKKPYKYSRKAGRYIPISKIGKRNFYYELLKSIEPQADFDPNSTYGKHIMSKTIKDLRKYKQKKQECLEKKSNLSYNKRFLPELKSKNKKLEKIRMNNAINDRASELVELNNLLVDILKKRPFSIAFFLSVVAYFAKEDFNFSFWILVGSYIFLIVLGNWIYKKFIKSYLSEAEDDLKNDDFGSDLRENEKNIKKYIFDAKVKIKNLQKELDIIKNNVLIKAQKLLNEDKLKFILSDNFYNSTDWIKIRNKVLSTNVKVCVSCGSRRNLQVDHIRPRSKFPEKALDLTNTQILCMFCNSSKGNRIT